MTAADPKLVDFDEAANLEFDPLEIDLADLPTNNQLINPHMVAVRLAAVTVKKTKGELIDVVVSLGGDRDDGGDLKDVVEQMQAAERLFGLFVDLLKAANARLFSAACASTR